MSSVEAFDHAALTVACEAVAAPLPLDALDALEAAYDRGLLERDLMRPRQKRQTPELRRSIEAGIRAFARWKEGVDRREAELAAWRGALPTQVRRVQAEANGLLAELEAG